MSLADRIAKMPRELKLFTAASLLMGVAYSLYDSTFNNFISARFQLTGFQRSFLEFPRELPGFLVVFVSALLWFLCSRRLGMAALVMSIVGVLLIGFIPARYGLMTAFLFLFSMGQHLFMPVAATIGMELARAGQTGRRLGQLNAVRNLAAILGSFLVYIGFRSLGFSFTHTFALTALGLGITALLMFAMRPETASKPKAFLTLHKEYRLFYLLNVLSGGRKQIFMTFAPWVIVSVFHQPTQTLATLLTISGVIGVLFQPILGRAIDHFGERLILASEAVLLVFVCLGYALARALFAENAAFLVICACFLLDQMLFSVGMARSMYMKKIAKDPGDIQPALTAGLTIDHVFSIGVALLGGVIWNVFGYQYVFGLGILIAALNFIASLRVRLPAPGGTPELPPAPVMLGDERIP